ncbi:MAG: GNAT family N-acetyltransferase, partial [Actinomycetota bacterium]
VSQDQNTLEVSEQLANSRRCLLQAADITFLVSRIERQIAGWCEVYVRDSVVQVENVMTFPEFRNRGIASSLVNAGLRLGYSAGADLGFLIADDEDWPKLLYSKLGFAPVGHMHEFTLSN